MDKITSFANGCAARINDSEQHVHSKPCNHNTGCRTSVSIARAIELVKSGDKPNEAVINVQNLRKLRRVMPCRFITS